MRGLNELVFSTTNQCTARCQDCPIIPSIYPPMKMNFATIKRVIDEVDAWGTLRLVVFTGGEPFLLGEDLRKAIAYISEKKIHTRIVTNAYWAKTKKEAIEILSDLKTLGLTEINISCDDYHQIFIPLENIKHANEAALETGLPALLAHRRKPGGRITVEYLSEYLGVNLDLFKEGEINPDNNVICTGLNIPLYSTNAQITYDSCDRQSNDHKWTGACKSVLKSMVVFPNLDIQICCGIALSSIPEFSIGSLNENDLLSILKKGNQDLIVNWLALEGPASILNFVRLKEPNLKFPEHFVSSCHVCNELFTRDDVRNVLRKYAQERSEALLIMRGTLDWISDYSVPN